MALAPIRLGSAASAGLIFEVGSKITTSDSGIQSCEIKALYPDGQNVFTVIPAAGVTFSTVFGNSYLPSTFKVDYTTGGPDIEYLDGQVARATITFKRQDPAQIGVRKIYVDSTLNYKSMLSPIFYTGQAASGEAQDGVFGFPEPVVTVKYNSTSQPGIGGGSLGSLYALPGSSNAAGFPAAPDISVPWTFVVPTGSAVSWVNGTTIQSTTVTVDTTFTFSLNFYANPRGWQLIKLKSDPVAATSFWDVEENWRNFYFFRGVTFVSAVPPIPPP